MVRKFVCRVVVYDLPFGAIAKGEMVMVHFYTSKCAGKIVSLISLVDPNSGAEVKKWPKFLHSGNFANIQIKLEERHCLELFKNFKNMGRVIVRKGDYTIAAGTVTEMLA